MYWQKFVELVEPITSYEYIVHIGVLIFIVGFVAGLVYKFLNHTIYETGIDYFASGLSGGVVAVVLCVVSPLLLLALVVFFVSDILVVFWDSAKKISLWFYPVLGIWLCVAATYLFLGFRIYEHNGLPYNVAVAIPFLTIALFAYGVFLHYEHPQNISADKWWRSGGRFVVGGVPWLISRVVYDTGELMLANQFETQIKTAVTDALDKKSIEVKREIDESDNDWGEVVDSWQAGYLKLESKNRKLTSQLNQKSQDYQSSNNRVHGLEGQVKQLENKLLNESRRNAAIKKDYEALQAKVLKEQFNDDDADNYMPDDLAPDSDGYVSLGDEWEG